MAFFFASSKSFQSSKKYFGSASQKPPDNDRGVEQSGAEIRRPGRPLPRDKWPSLLQFPVHALRRSRYDNFGSVRSWRVFLR